MPSPAMTPAHRPRRADCDMTNIVLAPGASDTSVVIPINAMKLSGNMALRQARRSIAMSPQADVSVRNSTRVPLPRLVLLQAPDHAPPLALSKRCQGKYRYRPGQACVARRKGVWQCREQDPRPVRRWREGL